jgi:hypothetical protein
LLLKPASHGFSKQAPANFSHVRALFLRMLHHLPYLVAGAATIAVVGRWTQQNKATVIVLCCLWGGFVGNLPR